VNKENNILIKVDNLKKYFPINEGIFIQKKIADVKAVDGVSFQISRGETLGLVGESGCGKTTTGRCLVRLLQPTEGRIFFDDVDMCQIGGNKLQALRQRMQVIFQDPYSSLNPRMTIGAIVGEPLLVHRSAKRNEIKDIVAHYLNIVGLDPKMANRFPHELSGGQRQRIGTARALVVKPSFILGDEPVSALDVSIQAQIINLLMELQEQLSLTYLIIAHDLSVVRHISDRVAIMYLGKLVEIASRDEIYEKPLHPYCKALLSAVPTPDPRVEAGRKRILLTGDVPTSLNPPSGCSFHPRCQLAEKICTETVPDLKDAGGGHFVACHLV
jgi:oligopeptide transport system ATP-binding protein